MLYRTPLKPTRILRACLPLLAIVAALSTNAFAQSLAVIAPNGGERYEMTEPVVVAWTAPATRALRIEFSPNGGRTWILVQSDVDATIGSLSFTPGYPTPFGRIRISDVDDPSRFDLSDGVFTILEAPSIAIYTPAEADRLIRGESYVISWLAGRIARVNIEYNAAAVAGGTWVRIASNVDALRGYFVWTVPSALTALGRIRILDANGPTIGETGTFSIVDPPPPTAPPVPVVSIRVQRPNGGEVFTVGDAITVSWASSNIGPTVTVALSSDGGATWTNVVTGAPSSAGVATFTASSAVVPSPGTNFRVRVTSSDGATDASDASFEIRRLVQPKITVIAPNGGEVFATDSTTDVTWTAVDISGSVDVEYSLDDGATWLPIASASAAAGTLRWDIPDELTARGRVRVVGGPIGDTSDAAFSIVEPESNLLIEVLSPNERTIEWAEATTATITWRALGVTRVDITLSTDGGASWGTTIAQNVAATPGAFDWRVPHLADTNLASLLVRVASTAGGSPFDYSDAPFRYRPTFADVDGDNAAARGIVVAPNPASTGAAVTWTRPMRSLRLFDATGALLEARELDRTQRAAGLRLDTRPAGLYVVELRGDDRVERVRMIVR
jgi:hypothetical protein